MPFDYEKLRRASDEIASRSARLALTTAIVLTIACLTFARALRSANSTSAIESAKEIEALARFTGESSDLPWIFHLRNDYAFADTLPRDAALLRKHTLEQRMQQDMDSWFSVEPNLGGWHVKFNILYWALSIPVVLLTAFSCLLINDAKVRAIHHLAATQFNADPEGATSFDRLTLGIGGSQAFTQYPWRINGLLYVSLVIGLITNIVAAASSYDMLGVAVVPMFQMALLTFYVAAATRAIRRKIMNQAYASAGCTSPPLAKPRLQRLRQRVVATASQAWKALSCLGGVLMLTTLLLTTGTAKSCSEADPNGMELFLNLKNEHLVTRESTFDVWGYRICVITGVLIVGAVLLALIPGVKRFIVSQRWLWRMLRALAMAAWFFVLAEFGFVAVLCGGPIQWPTLWEIVYWILPAVAYSVATAVFPGRLQPLWHERIRPAAAVLLAPAVMFVPMSIALILFTSDRPGVPVLISGAGIMALALRVCPLAD